MSKHSVLPWGIVATAAGAVTIVSGALTLASGILVIVKDHATPAQHHKK